MAEGREIPRNRRKARSGCIRCKQRRIKCDETKPACNQCTRRGYDCPGLSRPLKWSSKHETERASHAPESLESLSLAVTSSGFPKKPPHISHTLGGNDIPTGAGCPEVDNVLPEVEFSQYGMMAISDQYDAMATSVFPSHIPWDQFLAADSPNGQNHQHDDYQPEDFHDNITIPRTLYDRDAHLSSHYFSTICRINCAVDSSSNPLRLWVADSIQCSPLVYHCVLSMSAAHLAERDTSVRRYASQHRREAISRLESEILEPGQTICSTNAWNFDSKVLLSCILLGMTDSWHNPTMLGLKHLHGARLLFQRWASTSITAAEPTTDRESISFLTGLMAYWEALASFLKDQRLDAISYLSEFNYEKDSCVISNPWTGIVTPVFIYLARVGSIGRQQATLRRMDLASSNPYLKKRFQANLMRHAREIETALLGYRVPSLEKVEETHDTKTPKIHLQKAAQIYRLTALLELYGSFPGLLEQHTADQSASNISYRLDISLSSKILALATGILTIISSLPLESGTNAIMSFPLIVAGSALQSACSTAGAAATYQGDALFAEISSIHNEQGLREHWRPFVKTRFKNIHNYVGLTAVSRGLEVVERTWFRADLQNSVSQPSASVNFVHWTDVMVDERLETLFG